MRRRKYKPEISFIPKNKKLIDKASQVYSLLKTANSEELKARLNAELGDVSAKLKLSYTISEKQIYDFNDAWNKQTIPSMDVWVKSVDGLYLATTDGKTCELIDFENEYPFSDSEVGMISISPDAKNSDVYFRDTFFRIYNKGVTANETMIGFLNGIDPEKVMVA